jgi:hypothetical protein
VEGLAVKPRPRGAVKEGGGVHSMGKSGLCSARRDEGGTLWAAVARWNPSSHRTPFKMFGPR